MLHTEHFQVQLKVKDCQAVAGEEIDDWWLVSFLQLKVESSGVSLDP